MKSTISEFVTMILIVLVNFGCKQTAEVVIQRKPLFRIDLQQGFQKDVVQVRLDNQVLYFDTTTTLRTLGLAQLIYPSVQTGSHHMSVTVFNRLLQTDTTISVYDTLTVAVNLDRVANRLYIYLNYHYWRVYD